MQQYRKRRWFVIAATAAAFAAFAGVAPADAVTGSQNSNSRAAVVSELTPLIPETTPGSDAPAREAGANLLSASGEICTAPDENGRGSCIEHKNPDTIPALASGEASSKLSAVAPPQWCEDAQGVVYATRTQACRLDSVLYGTYVVRNGVRTTTGEATLLLINYSYGSTSDSRIAHQLDVTAFSGWGDALKGSYSGNARIGRLLLHQGERLLPCKADPAVELVAHGRGVLRLHATVAHRQPHRGIANRTGLSQPAVRTPPGKQVEDSENYPTGFRPATTNTDAFRQVSAPFPAASTAPAAVPVQAEHRRTPSPPRTGSLPSSPVGPARSLPGSVRSSSRT